MIGGSVGAASAELKNKMLQRCWGWDYKAPCIYLMTIVIADRRSMALGRLVVDNDGGGDPAKVMAHVEPSSAGRAVEAEWRRMGELTPAIKLLEIQIMPDHIHFIIRVTERLARPLGQLDRMARQARCLSMLSCMVTRPNASAKKEPAEALVLRKVGGRGAPALPARG